MSNTATFTIDAVELLTTTEDLRDGGQVGVIKIISEDRSYILGIATDSKWYEQIMESLRCSEVTVRVDEDDDGFVRAVHEAYADATVDLPISAWNIYRRPPQQA